MFRHFLASLVLVTPALAEAGPKVSTPTLGSYKTHIQKIKDRSASQPKVQAQATSSKKKHAYTPKKLRSNYPWKLYITCSVFWIGEKPTPNNPTPNFASSWDTKWQLNYGGYDNPDLSARANDYGPRGFRPRQNPFYIALPYNDLINHRAHKPEANRVIPWFRHYKVAPGVSVCKGRWVEIHRNGKSCFAQWEDCGPFFTDDWRYVFGNSPPKNQKNHRAGIDISPAVRDFMKIKPGAKVHWRFVEEHEVPRGPWSKYGANNPFVNPNARQAIRIAQEGKKKAALYGKKPTR